jgi:hypothetical protein
MIRPLLPQDQKHRTENVICFYVLFCYIHKYQLCALPEEGKGNNWHSGNNFNDDIFNCFCAAEDLFVSRPRPDDHCPHLQPILSEAADWLPHLSADISQPAN